MVKVLGIQRASRFSPNSVEKDLAILDAVVSRFHGNIISEDNNNLLKSALSIKPDIVFSMARDEKTLDLLSEAGHVGALVINSAQGVRNCQRSLLDRLMRENNLPVPPSDEDAPTATRLFDGRQKPVAYWLKRGDAAAQSHDDVVFCKDKETLEEAKRNFRSRGITDMVVQAHVEGDLVKFYGVEGTGFFRTFYPSDDGQSKFGDEKLNGNAHHYFYPKEHLQAEAEKTSRLVNVPVYGGDAIIRPDGEFVIIDFNDWPSFSRCRDDAAEAIISLARYNY